MRSSFPFLERVFLFIVSLIVIGCCRQPKMNHESLFAAAEKLQAEGNWKHALTIFEAVDEVELTEENRTRLYIGIGRNYFYLEQPQRAFHYFRQALAIDPRSAIANYELGNLHYVSSVYGTRMLMDSARLYVFRAMKLAKEKNDLRCLNQCYYRVGSIHQVEGHSDSSQWYFTKALEYALISLDTSGIARSYTHLALELKSVTKYDSSILLDTKAIELARYQKDRFALAFYLGNLGETYLDLGKLDVADNIILEATVHADMLENNLLKGRTYLIAAELYSQLLNHPKARQYYQNASVAGQRGNYQFYIDAAEAKLSVNQHP